MYAAQPPMRRKQRVGDGTVGVIGTKKYPVRPTTDMTDDRSTQAHATAAPAKNKALQIRNRNQNVAREATPIYSYVAFKLPN